MQLNQITNGQTITAADYNRLTCCGQLAHVGHATETLPEAGAVCRKCLCMVVSLRDYGPARLSPCAQHY